MFLPRGILFYVKQYDTIVSKIKIECKRYICYKHKK